jgi:hypothetical protein
MQFSLRPFAARRLSDFNDCFPYGLDLVPVTMESFPKELSPTDFFLWYQPQPAHVDLLNKIVFPREGRERRVVFHYENPAGYSFRKWTLKSPLQTHFGKIFSSVKILTDCRSHWWVPAWNYCLDFITRAPLLKFVSCTERKPHRLAVNPIGTGASVSDERIRLIEQMLPMMEDVAIFGDTSFINAETIAGRNVTSRGEIPYTEQPYIYRGKVDAFRRFNFTLTIENLFCDWYITEKLGEPLAALSIPVYFGSPIIRNRLPELFEYGAIDGSSFSSTIELGRFIDQMSEKEILSRQEVLLSSRGTYFALTAYRTIWDFVLSCMFAFPQDEDGRFLEVMNHQFAIENSAAEQLVFKQRIRSLIDAEVDDQGYNLQVRKLLRDQAKALSG